MSEELQSDEVRAAPPADGERRPAVDRVPPARWRGDGGSRTTRWATVGCGAGLLVLIGLLAVGVALAKRTAWLALDQGQRRLMVAVERLNDPSARVRTARNIDRFRARLGAVRDPYPMIGEFLERVRSALEDDSLTAGELAELNGYLESKLPGQGLVE